MTAVLHNRGDVTAVEPTKHAAVRGGQVVRGVNPGTGGGSSAGRTSSRSSAALGASEAGAARGSSEHADRT